VEAMSIAKSIAALLTHPSLPEDLLSCYEERRFQIWIAERIEEWSSQQNGNFIIKVEARGGGVESVRALGTTFWPDITIGSEQAPKALAVEVKCLSRSGLPNSFVTSIGQATMYRELYDECLVTLFVLGALDVEVPSTVLSRLSAQGIQVCLIPVSTTEGNSIG